MSAALGGHVFVPQGNPVGDAVQPAGHRLALADGGGAAGQDQEGGLESVLGVVLVVQDVPADAPHQPAVTVQQRCKGVLSTLLDEVL
jgi:hypothetical protein